MFEIGIINGSVLAGEERSEGWKGTIKESVIVEDLSQKVKKRNEIIGEWFYRLMNYYHDCFRNLLRLSNLKLVFY